MEKKALPILVFQTDFTYKEGAVAAMYGVVRSVSRDVEIITATHELPQYDIWSASYRLEQYVRFWPKGTVFVSVVDPGVGTTRKACCALTQDGYYIVTPDNGSLTHVAMTHGIQEIREIDETINRLPGTKGTSVFHGRDLFAYCAARLSAGIIGYPEVGPRYDAEAIVKLPICQPACEKDKITGIIEIDDPNFGNCWTNIPTALLLEKGVEYNDRIKATIRKGETILFSGEIVFGKTFGVVQVGQPVLYNNELMKLGFALAQGSFSHAFHIGYGPEYVVELEKI